jgi:superfamily II DNA or RNA helicase
VYGLTATPTRQDGHHPIIFMQCGEIAYRVDAKSQAEKRPFDHFVIPRFTAFKKISLRDEKIITAIYNDIMVNDQRNNFIVADVKETLKNNRTPIILTERAAHVKIFAEMLKDECENIIILIGSMSAKEKREATQRLFDAPTSAPLVVIATGKYVGEGFDFPRLDTLFLAMPIAWKGKVAQYAGRLHRLYDGKKDVLIYDYVDVHIPVLERMYHKRVKGYASIGYKTKAVEQSVEKTSIIYDGKSFLPVYNSDISNAAKEIVTVSPYMRKNRLLQMVTNLSLAVLNGASVAVVTRPPEDFKESEQKMVLENIEYLKNANIQVILKSNIHQKFTVIDGHIVWYGSVNFLSFGSNEESIMRLDSFDIGYYISYSSIYQLLLFVFQAMM